MNQFYPNKLAGLLFHSKRQETDSNPNHKIFSTFFPMKKRSILEVE